MNLLQQAQLLYDRNELSQAKKLALQALKQKPRYIPTFKLLGLIATKQEQYAQAIQFYEHALRIHSHLELHHHLAQLYAKLDNRQKTVHHYLKALNIRPESDSIFEELLVYLQSEGRKLLIQPYQTLFIMTLPTQPLESVCLDAMQEIYELLKEQPTIYFAVNPVGQNISFLDAFHQLPNFCLINEILDECNILCYLSLCQAYLSFGQDDLLEQATLLNRLILVAQQGASYFPEEVYGINLETKQALKNTLTAIHNRHPQSETRASYLKKDKAYFLRRQILNTEVIACFAWGSSGSIFLQSLFDSHPEVLMFPVTSLMRYHTLIWESLESFIQEFPAMSFSELVNLFVEQRPDVFDGTKNSTDHLLDQLGAERKTPLQVDLDQFNVYCKELWEYFQEADYLLNRKLFFLILHYAYAFAQGRSFDTQPVLFYPLHSPDFYEDMQNTLADFPNLRVIVTYRHPIKSMSSLLNMQYQIAQERESTYQAEDLVLDGIYNLTYHEQLVGYQEMFKRYPTPVYYLQLEELHRDPERIIAELVKWIGIQWDEALLRSTFNGLAYWGNRFSKNFINGFMPEYHRSSQGWKQFLNILDAYVLTGLLAEHVEENGYARISKLQRTLAPVFTLFPNHLEWKLLKKLLLQKNYSQLKPVFLRIQQRCQIIKNLRSERE